MAETDGRSFVDSINSNSGRRSTEGSRFSRPLTEGERFTLFEDPNITNVDQLGRNIRRNDTVRADLQSILGRKGQKKESSIINLQGLLRGIGRPLEQSARTKKEDKFLDAQRAELRNFINGVRSGKIAPEVTSPEQRERLIGRASGDLQRVLDAGQEATFGDLSRRGLLPEGGTGFSGPAASVISDRRASLFEDPLTSFITDLDIQTEADRVNRLQNLNDQATAAQERLLGSGESIFQFLNSLDLDDRTRQGSVINALLGNETTRQESALNRSFLLDQSREERRTAGNADGGLGGIGAIVGGIGGLALGGPAGALKGFQIGNQVGTIVSGGKSQASTQGLIGNRLNSNGPGILKGILVPDGAGGASSSLDSASGVNFDPQTQVV